MITLPKSKFSCENYVLLRVMFTSVYILTNPELNPTNIQVQSGPPCVLLKNIQLSLLHSYLTGTKFTCT